MSEYIDKRINEFKSIGVGNEVRANFLVQTLAELENEYRSTAKTKDTIKTRDSLLRMISKLMYDLRVNPCQNKKAD